VRRRNRIVAARRVVPLAERRNELAAIEQARDERNTPECHALPRDRRLDDLVVERKAHAAGGLERRLSVCRQPRTPVEPGHESLRIVVIEQDVAHEIGRPFERQPALDQRRARDRHQSLAEKMHRASEGRRVRKIANRNVHVAAREVHDAVLGGHIHVGVGKVARNDGNRG
jgi:hypothetical protein